MAAKLPSSFKPKAAKAAAPQPVPKKRGRPPKFTKDASTPASQAVSVPLGGKKTTKPAEAAPAIEVPARPAPKVTKSQNAPLPKPDKAKSLLKAALKEDPAPVSGPDEVDVPTPSLSVATPPPPTITHVNTALPQAPGRKIAQPTKRIQTASGKLSFDSILSQQNQPSEAPSPANDLLRYLKK